MANGSVDIHRHALERAFERGASESETIDTVEKGENTADRLPEKLSVR
jgi:hypothetical protein